VTIPSYSWTPNQWGFAGIVAAIQNNLGGADVIKVYVGRKVQAYSTHPPAIWIFHGGATHREPDGGGHAVTPTALQSRSLTLECHCWGSDYAQAEYLRDAVYSAAHHYLTCGRVRLGAEALEDSGVVTKGVVMIQQVICETYVGEVELPLSPASFGNYQEYPEVLPENVFSASFLDAAAAETAVESVPVALPGTTETVLLSGGRYRQLLDGSIATAGTVTLSTSGATEGDVWLFERLDNSGVAYSVVASSTSVLTTGPAVVAMKYIPTAGWLPGQVVQS
jgi:hypothetical protein